MSDQTITSTSVGTVLRSEPVGRMRRASLIIFTVLGVFTAVAPHLADWSVTHLFNPAWPPHAKFHSGHTMALGFLLGVATVVYAWRRTSGRRSEILTTAAFAGFYWISQAAADFYPGTAWTDPEFLGAGQSLDQLSQQAILDIVLLTIIALATLLALRTSARVQTRT